MKFLLYLLLSFVLVFFLNPFTPFWGAMIGLGVLALVIQPGGAAAFFGGGFGMSLAWMGLAVYLNIETGSSLPDKMAQLFGLGNGTLLILATGFLGFLLGAFSSWSGQLLRNLLKKKPENIYRG
ncbi:hypothetical protein E4S40_00600 [Algoriphagus kandeliae]|uniref:Uncharacterized protein n=1 Tax=Algoriphagus kandeliae TaxID=2562278 RepID=A0A4Y9QXX1_9BACT|nr:hypothetical protein [Algoriphagus kandeliae]TFV97189.1 hypothetical protein E4S40_00600 [Algoriphagus kandeliae]